MLFCPKDGKLKVYKLDLNKDKDPFYIEIMFYRSDFSAPIYNLGEISFSWSVQDNGGFNQLKDFFDNDKKLLTHHSNKYWVEYLWDGAINLGIKYKIVFNKENLILKENDNCLMFCFKAKVYNTSFIKEFTKGNEVLIGGDK